MVPILTSWNTTLTKQDTICSLQFSINKVAPPPKKIVDFLQNSPQNKWNLSSPFTFIHTPPTPSGLTHSLISAMSYEDSITFVIDIKLLYHYHNFWGRVEKIRRIIQILWQFHMPLCQWGYWEDIWNISLFNHKYQKNLFRTHMIPSPHLLIFANPNE